MGLPDAQPEAGVCGTQLGVGKWPWHCLARDSVCSQTPWTAPPQPLGRRRLRRADRGDGNHRTVPMDIVDCGTLVLLLENRPSSPGDATPSDCHCNSLVCFLVALSVHIWRSVVVPELRLQCVSVAPGWDPFQAAGYLGARTTRGRGCVTI